MTRSLVTMTNTTTTKPKGGSRPGSGRPKGSTKPLDQRMVERRPKMDDARWQWCLAQPGGASAYLRALIDRDRQVYLPPPLDTP